MPRVVFAATTTRVSTPDGVGRHVAVGEYWWADDPVVLANPWAFSDDPRHGMRTSVPFPEPDPDAPAPATPRKVRA